MAGRKSTSRDNRFVMEFLRQFESLDEPVLKGLPDWVDSCIAGQTRLGGGKPTSPSVLYIALTTIPFIDFNTASAFCNRKWVALGREPLSRSHCYRFFQRLTAASKAIEFHADKKSYLSP